MILKSSFEIPQFNLRHQKSDCLCLSQYDCVLNPAHLTPVKKRSPSQRSLVSSVGFLLQLIALLFLKMYNWNRILRFSLHS